MSDGILDCVVATSSLDLGIDWAEIDLVIQIGAPKGLNRLIQELDVQITNMINLVKQF